MDNSRRSVAPSEDSISMYLSFDTDADADDTLASKWQSIMASQTSQYLEMQSLDMEVGRPKLDKTLEEMQQQKPSNQDSKSVLAALINKENTNRDHASPLRPFDKSILNLHNALCSTPTKNMSLVDGQNLKSFDDKENTQPDAELQNSTLSSTIDATASTVKTNTMLTEANATLDELSVQENNNKTNVYPLNADVLLENITEVSNEEPSITVPSPVAVASEEQKKTERETVKEMVNEVSELISKVLKLTDGSSKQANQPKLTQVLPTVALPRPRRSYLPTVNHNGVTKQRMSIVVKTTLNSPARKLSTATSIARRSCIPSAKPLPLSGYRKSILPVSANFAHKSAAAGSVATAPRATLSAVQAKPKIVPDLKFNCNLCSAAFRAKNHLDSHMRTHNNVINIKNFKDFCCKFCDKKFALERALHIHLMQNCDKIPPGEKRKLQFTELNHVKKAQLPKIVGTSAGFNLKPRESVLPAREETAIDHSEDPVGTMEMAPPSVKKVAKRVAHAGVYRTPTKTVPCHICKLSFKSIIAYTNHCLTVHSTNQKQKTTNAPSAQD